MARIVSPMPFSPFFSLHRIGSRVRRVIVAAVLAVPLFTVAATAPVFPYPHTKDVLPNGLSVILVPMENAGLVAYYSVVRTGSRDEVEPGKSGFAHFFEHMMFRGTKKYPSAAYEAALTQIGASANAAPNHTCDSAVNRLAKLYPNRNPIVGTAR